MSMSGTRLDSEAADATGGLLDPAGCVRLWAGCDLPDLLAGWPDGRDHGSGGRDGVHAIARAGLRAAARELHMMDVPNTYGAFSAAPPTTDVPAWRVYLGLPWAGTRTPPVTR